MKKSLLCTMFAVLAMVATSCNKENNGQTPGNEMITIGITPTTISYEPLPGLRADGVESDLMAVQVYEVVNDELVPYANGLFSDWSALSFKGYANTTYEVEATMVIEAGTMIKQEEDQSYALPFECAVADEMTYSTLALEGIGESDATLTDGETYDRPNIDRYYGVSRKMVTAADPAISTFMKRMTFGIITKNLKEAVTLKITDAPTLELQASEIAYFSLTDFDAAYTADESETPYLEKVNAEIVRNGASVLAQEINVQRNKLVKIVVDGLSGNLGFDFEKILKVLTFEDEDYLGGANMVGEANWSSLIDKGEYYAGGLLYGSDMWSTPIEKMYTWHDENNTELAHIINESTFCTNFGAGGHAISNYILEDLTKGTFERQLSVPFCDPTTKGGGYNGSQNFAVHYGYMDDSGFGMMTKLPGFYFKDEVARVVDHMYVALTTYHMNSYVNGDGFCQPLAENETSDIVAIGYNGDEKVGEVKFRIAGDMTYLKDWAKWDLSALGKVTRIGFNIIGTSDNGYGFSRPAYFAYDNVAVQF